MTDEPLTLIYLDVDDEITSAAARIRGAGADRVALVLPYGSRLATSRINFRLLAREAAERGKHIEVICADASARALAVAAGLPVHPSVAAFEGREQPATPAEDDASSADADGHPEIVEPGPAGDGDDTRTRVLPVPRRSSPRVPVVGPPRPPVRTGTAIGLAAALLVLVLVGGFLAVEILPTATIVLHPRSADIGPIELQVEARTDVAAPDATALVIPATIQRFALAASASFPATGVRNIEVKATGNVTFSNFDTGRANRIDAGSIVKTESGIEFRTLATVTLPNATIQFPFTIVPSTSTVGVEAVVAGPEGNVGNNTITEVPKGENQRLLQVTNTEATSGGERSQAPQVSAADVDAARAAIAAELAAQLDQLVADRTGVPAEVTLFPETSLVGELAYAVDPATLVDAAVESFLLSATAEGTAIGVDPGPLEGIADARLRARVTPGSTLDAESVRLAIGSPTVIGDIVAYPLTIAGTQVRDVDAATLLESIRGATLGEAVARLDDYGDVEIELWPDWATTIPTRADRISFSLGEPQPSPTP